MNSTSQQPAKLVVLVDDRPQLEFDRGKALPDQQLAYLDRMDSKMDAGIQLDGASVQNPDPLQRARFVAIHMIEALQQDNEALVAASCAYLAQRLPDLQQVRAHLTDDGFTAELVFDAPYVEETVVEFMPRPGS
ncbi:MAG TPA: hypothetical protein ENJ80_14830 [Gammaproteobacteria bacterium]|nr:hypothetical protein [Gammaproteobacteria bacterium]